jgi:AcrR family transcriptional regulator
VAEATKPKRLTRAESRAETRRRLLDAAAAVFLREGFQAASVEGIAAEAGFTRGAFYSNFESKEQLFVELLHDRVYGGYRRLLERVPKDVSPVERLRWGARDLEERYGRDEDSWLFALWLECLAHAARHPEFRSLAATFWSGTRAMNAHQIEGAFQELGRRPPIEPKHLATALTALDIGLAVQNLVDPEEVPLDLYPRLYELLFAPLVAPE